MRRSHRLIGVVALLLAVVAVGAGSASAEPWPTRVDPNAWVPFFDSGSLQSSGWTSCAEPIVLTVDPKALPPAKRVIARQAFAQAVHNWAVQANLHFSYGGVVPVDYNRTTDVITPVDGVNRLRHIYITIVKPNESDVLSPSVVGFAMPTQVYDSDNEIVQAEGVFSTDYVASQPRTQLVAVFMHEIGHALGLGHSPSSSNVMYAIVDQRTTLGVGDIAGIKAVTKPCPA